MTVDEQGDGSPTYRRWQNGQKAEHEKLMAHIDVLRKRAEWLKATVPDDSTTAITVVPLVEQALRDSSWRRGGEDAHKYADTLEELLPLIANEEYLRAVLSHELARPDGTEPIVLTTIFHTEQLMSLMDSGSERGERSNLQHGRCWRDEVAETLRLLYQERADRLRHERLMSNLRRYYLPRVGIIIVLILALVVSAILLGRTGLGDVQLALWAEICACAGVGAIGASLSSALKIRDIAELNPFRNLVTFVWVQPIVGAAFGFVAWLILFSGLVTIGSPNTSLTRMVVAFAAGYSEPFLIGILNSVMGLSK
jgi:hypothetical protein